MSTETVQRRGPLVAVKLAALRTDSVGVVAGSRSLKLRRADTCVSCGAALAAGTVAYWDAGAKTVACLTCRGETTSVSEARAPEDVSVAPRELDRGTAGASARRRYERLHKRREQAAKDRMGKRLGGFYLTLSTEPQSTVAWAQGARGERLLGEYLEKLHDDETVVVLHDRRIPGSRANVDHIAVMRSGGVWAIDAKNYTGKVQRIDKGGWFSTDERLFVGRRDCTKLVAGMAKQVDAIKHALGEPVMQEFDVTVKAALCFVDAEWSLFAKPFALDGVWIGWAKALGTRLQTEGALAPEHVQLLARRVAEALPPA